RSIRATCWRACRRQTPTRSRPCTTCGSARSGGCMPIAGVPARSDSAAGATGAGSDVVALVQGAVRRPELVRRALGRVVVQGDRSPVDAVRCRPGLWMAVEGIGARGEEHGTVVQ